MTSLDELWFDLFDEKIDEFSRQVMDGVYNYADPDEPMVILAAIPTYILVRALLKDPHSPFRIAEKLGGAMRDLEAAMIRINRDSIGAQEKFANFQERFAELETITYKNLELAYTLAKQEGPAVKLQEDPFDKSFTYVFNSKAMKEFKGLIYKAAALSCVSGTAITMTILYLVK